MSESTQDGRLVITTETMVLPSGCTPEADPVECYSFAVFVRWMGPPQPNGTGGWAVTGSSIHRQLSRAGNWSFCVEKFRWHQYRFDSFEDALAMAHIHVDEVTVNGQTWAQWRELRGRHTSRA